MATNKLDRIERDIEKTKTKIAELQKQLRELEAAKDRTGEFADRPACARPEHDPAGVRRLCARRRFTGTPGPAAGV